MADEKLPHPATQADMYAHDIATQLRKLNANFDKFFGRLAPAEPGSRDEVELREPEAKKSSHRDAKAAAKLAPDTAPSGGAREPSGRGAPVTVETMEIVPNEGKTKDGSYPTREY